jgi:hypothetical protein
MIRRLSLALVFVLLVVSLSRASVPLVSWFSQRIVLLTGHPVRTIEAAEIPGLVAFFIRDDRNRATCVMLLRDMNTGAIYPLGQVDARSCAD